MDPLTGEPGIEDLMFSEPTDQDRAGRMAAALRGQRARGVGLQAMGQIMTPGGDPLSSLGKNDASDAESRLSEIPKAAQYGNEARYMKLLLGQGKNETTLKGKEIDAASREKVGNINAGARRDVAGINAGAAAGHDAARLAAARLLAENKLGPNGAQTIKGLIGLGKDTDPNSNPGLKPYRDLMFQADRLNALATDPQGALKDLDPSQMEELGLGLHRIFTGANRTIQAQVAALVPHTAMSDAKAFQRWFMNEPTGTNQLAFVQMMHDTINRERGVAASKLHDAQIQAAVRYAPHIRQNPQDAINIMKASGMDPDEVLAHVAGFSAAPASPRAPAPNAGGIAVPPAVAADHTAHAAPPGTVDMSPPTPITAQDAAAIAWAKAHPDDPMAKKILQLHGAVR